MSSWLLRTDTIVPFFFPNKVFIASDIHIFLSNELYKVYLTPLPVGLKENWSRIPSWTKLKTTGRTLSASISPSIPSVLLWPMKCLFSIDLLFISETLTLSCLVFQTLSRLLRVLSVLKGRAVLIVLPIKSIKSFLFWSSVSCHIRGFWPPQSSDLLFKFLCFESLRCLVSFASLRFFALLCNTFKNLSTKQFCDNCRLTH